MKKRVLPLLIAFCIVISLFPATAFADEPAEKTSGEALTSALTSGENITLTESVQVDTNETVNVTKPVVLDLNGYTIDWTTSGRYAIQVQQGGSLTIQDSSEGGSGALNFTSTYSSTSNYGIFVSTDGSLTFTGGTISYQHADKSGGAIYTNINAAFTMTGGTVKIAGASNYAMYLASSGLHQITGGTIVFDENTTSSSVYGIYSMIFSTSDPAGFYISGLTVDGSNIPDTKTVICVNGYNASTPVYISGGTFTANGNPKSYAVGAGSGNKTSISGGTFHGPVKAAVGKITGGIFSVQPSASYIASGKVYEKQEDNCYHVVDGSYVGRIGDSGYLTWDALFADASTTSSASAVYILSGAEEIAVPAEKNVTFYNSQKLSIGKLTNSGTCKITTYAFSGTEVVNNSTLSLDQEVGSLVNNAGGVVTAAASSSKVTGAITNHGVMTISKGTYLGDITNDGTLTITGGTFAQDVKDLCAEGYTTQQNKAGTWDVMADVPHVAEIGGYWYGSLSAALTAAQNGDTVKLLSDTTLNTKVSLSNKTLTLDMNGCKITYGASGRNYGSLVFMGASNITITGNGFFDFDDTYTAKDSKADGRIFNVNNSSVLTIENGTFHAGLTCVLADNNAKAILLGGTYSASQMFYENWFLLNLQDGSSAQILVYGGTFANYNPSESHTEVPAANFCAEGYTVTSEMQEGVTYYTVGPDSTQTFAAQIGALNYVSLEKALEAAKDGDTVTLLAPYTGDAVTIAKAITIDLAATGTASDKFAAEAAYQMATDGTKLVFAPKTFTVTFNSNGGSDVAAQTVAFNGTVTRPDNPARSGYTFGGWYRNEGLTAVYDFDAPVTSDITLYAKWTAVPSSGGSSGSGNKTETVTNPDGSTTTTVTKPDGSKTETTRNPDGSTAVVDTKKDGTVTTTTTDTAGNKTQEVKNTDGTSQTTITNKDGSSSTTKADKAGKVETQVKLPASVVDAAGKGKAVALPMPAVSVTSNAENAPTVTVDLPADTTAKVEIPVKNVTSGTVAVRLLTDGTQEIIVNSLTTGHGVSVTLSDGDTVKVLDNSKDFVDVPDSHWASDSVDFVTSRELFDGTGATTFTPAGDMTRAMVLTVLARYEGVDTTTGDTWYEAGMDWAVENGISDGTNPMVSVTREQLALMLYRYVGSPAVSGSLGTFSDAGSVSDWAAPGMIWAVENGLITGTGNDTLNPLGTASRAEVSAMFMRFIEYQNK